MAVTVPSPLGRKDTPAQRRARDALVRTLWNDDGSRKLPRQAALVSALSACHRDDVWWVCEASSAGPLYLLPTVEWVAACATLIAGLGVRSVLEIGAGDGFLAAHLGAKLKTLVPKLRYVATDNFAWSRPRARMSRADEAEFSGVRLAGIPRRADVIDMAATTAVKHYKPDLVLVSWAPPGLLVERAIAGPCLFVLDITVGGDVCGNGGYTWRHEHAIITGPVVDKALCRLDARPKRERHTLVTLYRGGRNPG